MATRLSGLSRPIQPMPGDVAERLERSGLAALYATRPAYQRNDYLGWIAGAKRPQTREKRIARMLEELQKGNVYMGMAWRPGRAQT